MNAGRHFYSSAYAIACGVALSSIGCSEITSTCSRDADSVTVSKAEGITEGNVYRSAPFGGPYEYFPPARTISFEHGLNAVPYSIQLWLAFSPHGVLAPSAGNMTELRPLDPNADAGEAVDDQQISVYNDTCSTFYLYVVAERAAQ